ncbi:hypothetical protein [Actinoplanes sp. TFC3]|uniref:hypothetical protein n=1 Tax=Actinoplanes sp. TFC3 TaxID=1710355 RepID=UPI00082DA70F|nr:hypothetical protein [Actinoplanes sp. TFC3]
MPKISFAGVTAASLQIDDPKVLDRAKNSPEVHIALQMLRPRNWWGAGISPNTLQQLSRDDGIPVAWVPPTATLNDLASAANSTARSAVLLAHEGAIVDDCVEALYACVHPWLADEAALAHRALSAYKDGHYEAAMALAIALGEPLAKWWSVPQLPDSFDTEEHRQALQATFDAEKDAAKAAGRKLHSTYQLARALLDKPGIDPSRLAFRWQIVAAPIPKFFTPWRDGKDLPPDDLSRHVIAHRPTVVHMNRRNALVAQMLVTSLLREWQHWAERLQDLQDLATEPE